MSNEFGDRCLRAERRELPRRGLLGLAAGLLAAVGGAAPEADARRRRRQKRKKYKGGKARCGKRCRDLRTDDANCGACGAACPAGRSCRGGVCACPDGQSLVAGACLPQFGCTPNLDTCTQGKKACPVETNEQDARCYVTADGQPFCGTSFTCDAVPANGACPTVGGEARTLIPCAVCDEPGETGACVRPISVVRPGTS